jgi:hypothetical protein
MAAVLPEPAKSDIISPEAKFQFIKVTDGMLSKVGKFNATTARRKKRPLLEREAHIKLIHEKNIAARAMKGHITLFRVLDKPKGTKEREEHIVPGPDWTPPSSVGFVMGGLSVGHRVYLATEPTEDGLKGAKGVPSIYAREIMTTIMYGWRPRRPKSGERYGRTGSWPKVVLTPPSSPIRVGEDDMAKIFDVNTTWEDLPMDLSELKGKFNCI